MTHAYVDEHHLENIGVTAALVGRSIDVENYEDLIWDISQALEQVTVAQKNTFNSFKLLTS